MGKEKIVIVGMGYLATYVMPCYERLLGDEIKTNCIGIKGSERGLAERQAQCPFPVIVGRVRETLEERRPDIIVLAVKPEQIAAMTEGTLAPYYQMLREKGEKLPDLYSFAPDPTVDYFYGAIGSDVNAANMIPNMVSEIAGLHVAPVGVSFVAFDPRREWPQENRKRALEFMIPTGTVVEVGADKAIPYLSAQCACHLMFELNYIAQDVQKEFGLEKSLADSASAYRSVFHRIFKDPCTEILPCSGENVSPELLEFMDVLMEAWREGVLRFTESEKIPFEAADRQVCGSMETYQMEAQLEPKEQLVQNTKNHATPGGFLEMCLITFHKRGYEYVTEQMRKWLKGERNENLAAEIADISFEVAKAISDHGKTVSGIKK